MEHFMSDRPVMAEATANHDVLEEEDYDPADENIVSTIKELLETRVRPAVAQDGGDITFHGYREGRVLLHERRLCGLPSSTATLKHGIQNLLRHFIPEVEGLLRFNPRFEQQLKITRQEKAFLSAAIKNNAARESVLSGD